MQDELDVMLNSHKAMQAKDDEIADLKQQLYQTEFERDGYLKRCQELEKRFEEEESRYWQIQNGRQTTDLSRPSAVPTFVNDRIQQRLDREAQNSHVGGLFNLIDQTDMNSFMNQTQATVDNIEKHARGLTKYQSGIQALYNQLKHTAKFLADIVHSLGLDDAQIELIMQKINELQLNIQETGEMSAQLAGETQQIVNELSAFSMRLEQSMRNSLIEPVQSSFVDASHSNNKALDSLIAKNNAEFSEKETRLQSEINALQDKVENIRLEKENFEVQVDALTKDKESVEQHLDALAKEKKEIAGKYATAVKLLAERDSELENRKFIIEELRIEADKPKLPDNLDKDIEDQLQNIYNTMSNVTDRLRKIH